MLLLIPQSRDAVYNHVLEWPDAAVVWFCVKMQRGNNEGTSEQLYSVVSV